MKSKINKFKFPHIAITVDNINDTKEFYKKIGFEIIEEIYSKEKQRYFLLLEGYNFQIEVFHFDYQKKNQTTKEDEQKVGINHFALPVNNLQKIQSDLAEKGINFSKEITVSSTGLKYLNIIDPSGITIEFFEL